MNLWKDKWGPMLLEEINNPFNSKDYIYEVKFDGIRAIVYIDKDVKIVSRNGVDITEKFPELQDIRNLVTDKIILDGEIVAMQKGKPSFKKIQERLHLKSKVKIENSIDSNPVCFVCFDILYKNKNLINMILLERKKVLEEIADKDYFIKVKYIENEGVKLFESVKKMGLEGIVAKKKDSYYYVNERSDVWLKIKNIQTDDFYIGGYIEKENSFVISLLLGEYKTDEFCYVGKVILSKRSNLYKKVKEIKKSKKNVFQKYLDNEGTYLSNFIKIKVSYLERTKNGHLRHPEILDNN